jgi:hypothetical protein
VGGSDADLRAERIIVTRNKVGPGDTPNGTSTIERLVTLNITYEVWVDNTESTNLTGKWDSVRTLLIDKAKTILTGGSVAVIDENPAFDTTDNKITGTITVQGSTSGGVVEYRQTVEDNLQYGKVLVPAWTGVPFHKYPYWGAGTWQVTLRSMVDVPLGVSPGPTLLRVTMMRSARRSASLPPTSASIPTPSTLTK